MTKKFFTIIIYFALFSLISGCSIQTPSRSAVPPDVAIDVVKDHITETAADFLDKWMTAQVNVTSTIPVFETDDTAPDYYLYLLDCKGTFCGEVLVNVRDTLPSVVESSANKEDIWTPKLKNRRAYRLSMDWFFVEKNGTPSSTVITSLSPEGVTKSDFDQILVNYRKNLKHQLKLKKYKSLFYF